MSQQDFMDGAPAKSGGSGKWIAACCGCLLLLGLLVVGGAGLIFFTWKKTLDAYDAEATAFLAAAAAGDVEGAYARFSAPLKQAQSLEEFRAGVQNNPDLFQAQDVSFNSVESDAVSGVTRVKGTVTSATGKVRHCVFAWIEEGGQKRLIEYQISDSPQ